MKFPNKFSLKSLEEIYLLYNFRDVSSAIFNSMSFEKWVLEKKAKYSKKENFFLFLLSNFSRKKYSEYKSKIDLILTRNAIAKISMIEKEVFIRRENLRILLSASTNAPLKNNCILPNKKNKSQNHLINFSDTNSLVLSDSAFKQFFDEYNKSLVTLKVLSQVKVLLEKKAECLIFEGIKSV